MYILGGLLVILAATVIANWGGATEILPGGGTPDKFVPIPVANPLLRLDLLEQIRKQPYETKLNIFTGRPVPRPEPAVAQKPTTTEVPGPPPEIPLQVPYKFYGIVADAKSKRQRACFTNGEDVFILAEGEMLANRFRLLRIGPNSADVEEVSSGKRATLPLEQPAGPGA
jgi:hypothetical protein